MSNNNKNCPNIHNNPNHNISNPNISHQNSSNHHNIPKLSGVFLSTFDKTLDKQSRVCIPLEFRQVLLKQRADNIQVGFVAFRSYAHPAIECYSIERMELLSHQMDNMDPFNPMQDDFNASVFADSHLITFDMDEGRIKIPSVLLEHANINESKNISFVGKGTTFQIWETNLFKEHQSQARKALQEKWLQNKLAQSNKS